MSVSHQKARLVVLDQLINQQLILQETAKDSLLEVSEEELEDRVQQQIDGQVRQFGGSLVRLQQVLAEQSMTMALYREQQKNLIRSQLLQERYFAKRGQSEAGIVVTEEEARTYFNENPDLIADRPTTILFESIQLQPEPSDAAKAEALAEADSVLGLLGNGEEFAELARRFSDDGSASGGGELGWNRQEDFVEEFSDVAFEIPPGVVSPPVETQFGYHLILVERVRGGERRVRHILFQPAITTGEMEANDARSESFADRLRAGETMSDLGQEADTVDLPLDAIAQTSRELATAMEDAQVGDVVGPARVDDPQSESNWILVRMLATTPGGPGEFFEFQDMIVERLRSEGLTESVIESLRSQAYIDIRIGGG